ncbi:hypothetical protein DFH06DRAFT_1301333 [Mycena polygramma]|nr:hypothetical protein DFH06DRAFT_1301333 [Mycena polygramma]
MAHSESDREESPAPEVHLDPADARTISDHLKVLKQALKVPDVPYTGGVHSVSQEDLAVYYNIEGERNARYIDFGNATEEHVVQLAAACQKATFGMDQTDVLDESYRKAGKKDRGQFAARLDVVASGILDAITPDILDGQKDDSDKVLRAEMYKLNVYGPGSFFKEHRDTPPADNMIGSLVVVFPTAHEGGALTLSHGGTTCSFDSAAQLAAHGLANGAVAYVAFYSDVTHAVEPVVAGYRVTLTYNLFLVDRPARIIAAGARIVPAPEQIFERALHSLLADSTFLPTGGLLAYGLAHQYPMPRHPEGAYTEEGRVTVARPSPLPHILTLLKGSDARIRTVSERLGLATHIKILYDSGENYCSRTGRDVLADDILDMEGVNEEFQMDLKAEIEKKGAILRRVDDRMQAIERKPLGRWDTQVEEPADAISVHWVTTITKLNRVSSQYVAYGNETELNHVYGNAALFVTVPAVGDGVRSTGTHV